MLNLTYKKNVRFEIARNECYCGNTYGSYGLASQHGFSCGMSCPNNNNETCGGSNANEIYLVLGKCIVLSITLSLIHI